MDFQLTILMRFPFICRAGLTLWFSTPCSPFGGGGFLWLCHYRRSIHWSFTVSSFLQAFVTSLQAFRKLLRACWQAVCSASPASAGPLQGFPSLGLPRILGRRKCGFLVSLAFS